MSASVYTAVGGNLAWAVPSRVLCDTDRFRAQAREAWQLLAALNSLMGAHAFSQMIVFNPESDE